MRKLAVVALVLLLPGVAGGQIFRRPRVGTTPRPVPLPPELPGVRPVRAYTASRLSLEAYPILGIVNTDRYLGSANATNWAQYGSGLGMDWRFSSLFSATGDFTGTNGGPFTMNTVELGMRFHPERPDRMIQPYVDARGTWAHTEQGFPQTIDGLISLTPFFPLASVATTTSGFGVLAGAGLSYAVSPWVAITTGLSVGRNQMTRIYSATMPTGANWAYRATTERLTIGLRYTPQHRSMASHAESSPK